MFNRIVQRSKDMVLYNSRYGKDSIIIVTPENQMRTKELLSSDQVSFSENDDAVADKLIQYGYLVSIDCDEKLIRNYIQNTVLCDPSLSIVVHLTQNCNFNCTYCYMNHTPISLNIDAQNGLINFVRKNISRYTSVSVSWFGGEPTLEMEMIERLSRELIDVCRKANKPYSGIITTNGYLLTPKNIDILLKSRINTISVTIDGEKEVHDKQRVLANGEGTFDKIVSNLLYIKNNVRKVYPEIIIRMNITESHKNDFIDACKHFDALFGDDRRFSIFVRPVADYGGTRVHNLSSDFITDMSDVYEAIALLDTSIGFNFNFQDLSVGGSTCKSKSYAKFTIGCDGSVHKCDESLNCALGHLSTDGVVDINLPLYSKWLCGKRSDDCDNCFFSLCCFMEGCPRERVFNDSQLNCHINFHEIDSLIWCFSKRNHCKII